MTEAEGAAAERGSPLVESVVLDLTDLPLEDLAELPQSVLGETLRRLHAGVESGDPFVTGYSESQ